MSTRPSTATPSFGAFLAHLSSLLADSVPRRFVADVYTELILRFAKSINSASATLFKAKVSPWAKGAGKKMAKPGMVQEEPEEIDTVRSALLAT